MKQHKGGGSITTTTLVDEPAVDDDLYAVAMLKVAMELKKSQDRGFEEVFEGALQAMDIDRERFRQYLSRHMDRLMLTAKKRRY